MPAHRLPPSFVPILPARGSAPLDSSIVDALSAACRDATLFATVDWFEHLARTAMQSDAAPGYLLADTDGPACVPVVRRRQGSVVRLEALANFYSPEFQPIAHPSQVAKLAAALAAYAASPDARVDVVDLRPLDCASTFYGEVQGALRAAGFWCDTYFCFGNWYLELNGESFEDYFARRPSQLRNTWRRNRKKLEQRGLEILILRDNGPMLESAISDYEAIYNSSWKHPEPYPQLIPGLVRMTAKHGWLRLGLVRVEGKAVAAQIWFVKDRVASIFKLAYIEEYGKLSAGTILTHELMRAAIDDDRVGVIDYLSGDDPYKKDWMTSRRERRGVIAFNRHRLAGMLGAARHFGGRWWKSFRTRQAAAPPH